MICSIVMPTLSTNKIDCRSRLFRAANDDTPTQAWMELKQSPAYKWALSNQFRSLLLSLKHHFHPEQRDRERSVENFAWFIKFEHLHRSALEKITSMFIAAIIFASPAIAHAACGTHDETGNNSFEASLCATVVETCDPANPGTACENIIVLPLTDEDLQAQPPVQDVIDAWRLNGIEPAVGVVE